MVPDSVWNIVSQISHVLGGMCVVSYTALLFGKHALWYSVPVFVGLAGIKEFIFDNLFETVDESGGWVGDFIDFGFYMVGLAVGLGLIYLI
jgi:hypothetical protein